MSGTVVIKAADADHHLRHLTGWLRGEDDLRGPRGRRREADRAG
ncbi:hypothetical protein [Amycolatopsis sp. H20-H5]|nr:hypothetical protein [Amycolatopsis sp. H20-H5]MEC3974541.1 hypothetical protein [Amycolatopsis sp. H20-H5]